MKTPKLTYEDTLKLMHEGWELLEFGPPMYRQCLIRGNSIKRGLHNPVSSRIHRAGLVDPADTGDLIVCRYKLSAMGHILAEELLKN